VVVLTDGARYNHTTIQTHFSDAVHIVDLFHAYEHLTALAQILWGPEAPAPKTWRDWLEAGDIGRLIRQVSKQQPASAKSKKSMLKQLRYFENNAPQMRCAEYREKKFFVGSGVVEAGCRTVIGERLKQSGPGDLKTFGPLALRSSPFYLVHPRRIALPSDPTNRALVSLPSGDISRFVPSAGKVVFERQISCGRTCAFGNVLNAVRSASQTLQPNASQFRKFHSVSEGAIAASASDASHYGRFRWHEMA
jgi:hypothetical protein